MPWPFVQVIEDGLCTDIVLSDKDVPRNELLACAEALTSSRSLVSTLRIEHLKKDIGVIRAFTRCIPRSKVRNLVLSRCSIEIRNDQQDSAWSEFMQMLSEENCTVSYLELTRCQLTEDSAVRFANAIFRLNSKVKEFRLHRLQDIDDPASNITLRLLSTVSYMETRIERLNVASDDLDLNVIRAIADILEKPTTMLTHLALCTKGYENQCIPILANSLTMGSCKLISLILEDQEPDVDKRIPNALAITNVLCHPNNKLQRLAWRQNQAGDAAMLILASALRHPLCKITDLDLRFTGTFGDSTTATMAQTIRFEGNRLINKDLMSIGCDNDGVLAIASALGSSNNQVTSLTLMSRITSEGILAISRSLESPNNKLKILRIESTLPDEVFPEGAVCRLFWAARRSQLRMLDIRREDVRLEQFTDALAAEWFSVLCVLLSVRTVPRLGKRSTCSAIPFEIMIPSGIGQTLGWPLEHLRLGLK